jgi:hypothetical protein
MSDLHRMPLMGHDLPEYFGPRVRRKARIYWAEYGYHWEHECAPGYWKDSGFPYVSREGAIAGALKHLGACL